MQIKDAIQQPSNQKEDKILRTKTKTGAKLLKNMYNPSIKKNTAPAWPIYTRPQGNL